MSYRLFAAIRPPEHVREKLLSVMGDIDDARWQTDDQLHLTLAFFGELDGDEAEDLAEALQAVGKDALSLSLGMFGTFHAGHRERTSSLWIGVGPADPLAALSRSVRNAARRVGLVLPARRFIPHITLARFRKEGAAPEELSRFFHRREAPVATWQESRFHLMESFRGEKGAHYVPVASYRLRESSAGRYPP